MQTREVEHSPAGGFSFYVLGFRVVWGKSSIPGRLAAYKEIFVKDGKHCLKKLTKLGCVTKKLSVNGGIFNHFSDSVLAIATINSSCQDDTWYPDHSHICILM